MNISKSQVLEIVYHAHGAAVEGVIGEGKCFSWGGERTEGEIHEFKRTKKMFFHVDFLKLYLKKKHNITEFLPNTTLLYN